MRKTGREKIFHSVRNFTSGVKSAKLINGLLPEGRLESNRNAQIRKRT